MAASCLRLCWCRARSLLWSVLGWVLEFWKIPRLLAPASRKVGAWKWTTHGEAYTKSSKAMTLSLRPMPSRSRCSKLSISGRIQLVLVSHVLTIWTWSFRPKFVSSAWQTVWHQKATGITASASWCRLSWQASSIGTSLRAHCLQRAVGH